jgi:FkbM family methyltransferase
VSPLEKGLSQLNLLFRKMAGWLSPIHPVRRWTRFIWEYCLYQLTSFVILPVLGEPLRLVARLRSFPLNYQPEALPKFLRLLSPGDIFWDVGAHIGIYSLLAAKRVGLGGTVVAFEGNPETHRLLELHIKANHLEKICSAVHLAVSDGSHRAVWFSVSPDPIHLRHRILNKTRALGDSPPIEVPAGSLDDWARKSKTIPDFIRVDIEGAELRALQGAAHLLRGKFGGRPYVFLRVHPKGAPEFGHELAEIDELVRSFQYSLLNRKGEICRADSAQEHWMVPNEKRRLFLDVLAGRKPLSDLTAEEDDPLTAAVSG